MQMQVFRKRMAGDEGCWMPAQSNRQGAKEVADCSKRKAIICRLSAYEQADDVTDVRKEVKGRSDSRRI